MPAIYTCKRKTGLALKGDDTETAGYLMAQVFSLVLVKPSTAAVRGEKKTHNTHRGCCQGLRWWWW